MDKKMDSNINKIAFCLLLLLSVSYLGFFIMSQEPLECEDDEYKLIFCNTSYILGDEWTHEPDGIWAMCVKSDDNETKSEENLK